MAERKLNANAKRFEDFLREKGITKENRKTLAEINEMAKEDGVELFKTGSLNSVVNGDLTTVKAVKEKKEVVQIVKKEVNTYWVEDQQVVGSKGVLRDAFLFARSFDILNSKFLVVYQQFSNASVVNSW